MGGTGVSDSVSSRPPAPSGALTWLRNSEQPSIRYRALTELLERPISDPEVRRARADISKKGWVPEILAERDPSGGWNDGRSQYRPKYTSTNWRMIALSELGVDRSNPVIRDACERWMNGFVTKIGALGGNSAGMPHYCVAANLARSLIRFGFEDDPRVRRTLDWLVGAADPKGGWNCFGVGGRNLDSWEAMSVFAVYPRTKWTSEMTGVVERAAEYYLQRELHRQGERYAPWYRFHFPVHYYYDILVGLDFMTRLGYGADPRLDFALDLLRSKRRSDGRWNLDAVHPDVEGPVARFFSEHPGQRPTPWGIETAGRPSAMITLTALHVLSAAERARGSSPKEPR